MEILAYVVALIALVGVVVLVWLYSRAAAQARASEARVAELGAERDAARESAENALNQLDVQRQLAAEAQSAVLKAKDEMAAVRDELAQATASLAKLDAQREAALEQVEDIKANREELANQFKTLSTEVLTAQNKQAKADTEERMKATEATLSPVKESMEKLQAKLEEVERQRDAANAALQKQVEAVQLTSVRLGEKTESLATALRKPQTRGAWGELQLRNVVEAAGMKDHVDFFEQETGTNDSDKGIRPDMVVHMGEGKHIFIDSKVPMQAFLDAMEKDDEEARAEELKRVAKHVRTHIDQLSSKGYFTSDAGSPEFVVLFIPSEAIAIEALSHDPSLHEYAFSKNIVIATPSSLVAMLKTVNYAWQQYDLAENAQAIAAAGATLYKRLATLASAFASVGKSLDSTVANYNKAVGSLEGSVLPAARKMSTFGVAGEALKEPQTVEKEARAIVKPELVEIEGGVEEPPELEA
ncbi:MAG: DNA recombination protein RmuC [Propionibacteriaceae bacterium]|jgi:DNA recombination protein RmuC|nr:DNA recombination protein RmuC [Propionibacteriaceae bacterium]